MKPTLHVIHLKNFPIFKQLQLEEALLRTGSDNYLVLNEGSERAIVMGISGKEHELVDMELAKSDSIPLIRRYSGGGTVIVDEDTFFVSFILKKELFNFPIFPERILRWSEGFYQSALSLPSFRLVENDYTLGNLKCGGNAQYIKKDRFVHHTTFLWDFKSKNMNYLLHPKKTPKYREGRNHLDFLCTLKEHIKCHGTFTSLIKDAVKEDYEIVDLSYEEAAKALDKPHRTTTTLV